MKGCKMLIAKCVLVSFLLFATGCAKNTTENIYQTTVQGHNGPMDIAVTMKEEQILAVSVLQHTETKEVASRAIEKMQNEIVRTQSIQVDCVNGATITCEAILKGVSQCAEMAGISIQQGTKPNIESGLEETIVKEADVVVIGCGGAGLAAAVSAKQLGASVLILEKMPEIGGNTVRSIGMYNAVDEELQHPLGIYDSEEIYFRETFEGGYQVASESLVRILTSNADEGMRWLENLGLEFDTVIDHCLGGAYARGHYTKSHTGMDYIQVMQQYCEENQIEILLETEAKKLIKENNQISGVIAEYQNEEIIVKARKGVILATGGFGYNVEMRLKYDESLSADLPCSNAPGTTGDGIRMAEEVGANLIHMEHIEMYPLGDAYDGGLRYNIPNSINTGILINLNGERFIAEDSDRDTLSTAILNQDCGFVYSLVDGDTFITEEDQNYLAGLVSMGVVTKEDSLEKLATRLNLPVKALKSTILTYNQAVTTREDQKFARKTLLNKIDTPPYYAMAKKPTIHQTLGGVQINENAQVINTLGEVIKGLYAAGEVTGGIHGANRLGGNSLTDVIVFGRIAGENAAK